jgi:PAS domain S-box-containing protein
MREHNQLRRQAEAKIPARINITGDITPEGAQKIIHELQVHQLELELQNENLRQTTIKLEESRARYTDLYDFAPVGYLTLDRYGMVQEANLTAATLLGIDRGRLINSPLHVYMDSQDRERWRGHCNKVLTEPGRHTFEVRLRSKAGDQFDAWLESMAVEDMLGHQLWRTALTDITARKQTEEELKNYRDHLEKLVEQRTAELVRANEQLKGEIAAKQRLEEEEAKLRGQLNQSQKMQAVGTLAGGIAHEFNNIMGIIMGFTELALLNLDNPAKLKYYLEQVLKGSLRARDLVKQILAFSRPGDLKLRPLKLGLVLREAFQMLRSTFPTSMEIRFNVLSEGMVQADVTQIQQLLINLFINASRAMRPEGGILEISLTDIEVDASFSHLNLAFGPYIKLSVSDNGSGMPPEVRERIFEPFFTTKGLGEGTGLGLAVVYGIMQGCGGAITVESEPGQGSTFHLFFPRIQDTVSAEPSLPLLGPLGKGRILFVDDEPEMVKLAQQMLEYLGYQVIGLTSSEKALKVFRAQPENFDLVITDQTMPQMSGARLAAELMRLRPDIPVILCTGYSEVITAEKAQEIGIKTILMKPVGASELARVIRRVLEQGKNHEG